MNKELSDSRAVKILADACIAKGLRKVVISSGSRNAPLILTFNRLEEIETYTITDERSAAFFALGMAEQLGEPIGLICTSGTAILNYSPAIAEAYYKGIPLVVMSADRPIEQIDQGDGQAIRQTGALANFVKYYATLPIVNVEGDEWHVKNLLTNAFFELTDKKHGPVHINIPLNEPLYGTCSYNKPTRLSRILETQSVLSEQSINALCELLSSYEKILILPCVANINQDLSDVLENLSKLSQVVVLSETINNLHSDNILKGVDKYVKAISKKGEEYKPDIVLTFGDILVSRMIKKYFKDNGINTHWHISVNEKHVDMFHNLTFRIDVEPEYFFNNIRINNLDNSNYRALWLAERNFLESYHETFSDGVEWSDYKVFSLIAEVLPKDYMLHSGNSTVIRYLQLIEQYYKYRNFCNRGTSGIDGSVSTAVGAAWVNGRKNLLITGDLSFFYDSNALWNRYVSDELKIIVVNNKGGGIFRFIDGPSQHEELGEFFEHSNTRSAKHLADSFKFGYFHAEDEVGLKEELVNFFSYEGKAILEVNTPREINDIVLREYFKGI